MIGNPVALKKKEEEIGEIKLTLSIK